MYLAPIGHVIRMIYFEGSSDKTDPRPRWLFLLPFAPARLPGGIWSGTFPVGYSTEEGFGERLVEQISVKIDQELKPVASVEAFYEMTLKNRATEAGAGLWALDRNPAHQAVVLAALGRLDRVAELALPVATKAEPYWQASLEYWRRLAARAPNNKENQRSVAGAIGQLEMCAQLRQLAALAQARDRVGIAGLLHRWEAQNVRAWEVEDLWQSSPFPIELGEGD